MSDLTDSTSLSTLVFGWVSLKTLLMIVSTSEPSVLWSNVFADTTTENV